MAGQISSFLSSGKLIIRMGNLTLAHATNLSFSDRMSVAPVGGIGSFSADALEPLQYSSGGSMTLTVYTEQCYTALAALNAQMPSRVARAEGNSLLTKNGFSPLHLLISRSFDIDVYERKGISATDGEELTYRISDCRLTSYSMTFTPGSLIQENVGFICMSISDTSIEPPKAEFMVSK
jgi:hypothetical protein